MKRAWPYAVALAVVVTGCYLALAPLLRSISPAAPTSQAAPQLISRNTTTVAQVAVTIDSSAKQVAPKFSNNLAQTKQQKAAKAAKAARHRAALLRAAAQKAARKRAAEQAQQAFVANQSKTSSSSSSSTSSNGTSSSRTSTTSTPVKTTTPKTTTSQSRPVSRGSVGGSVNQADNGGLASPNKGDNTVAAGTSQQLAP